MSSEFPKEEIQSKQSKQNFSAIYQQIYRQIQTLRHFYKSLREE
jgi:hypothetical protein